MPSNPTSALPACSGMNWPAVAALLLCVLFFAYLAYLMAHHDD